MHVAGTAQELSYFKQKLVELTLAVAPEEELLLVRHQIEILKDILGIVEEIANE